MAAAFLLAAPLHAADVSQPEPRLVDLNVVALDNHGEPVTDLTSADFEVTDAGKQEQIAFFHHTDSSQWESKLLGPKEFSNRSGSTSPYATVILFDLMNESFGTRGYATNQIIHTLENMESADYLYLYFLTLDGHLMAIHGFPGSETPPSPNGEPWTRQIKSLLDNSMRTATLQRPVDVDVAGRVYITFQALENLAVQMSRVPGRKSIVWVSDGVPIALGPERSDTGELIDFTNQIRKLGETFDRFDVAIYPVRQVIFGGSDDIGQTSDVGQTGGAGTGLQSQETLNLFANMTGGRPTTGKDIALVLKQAMTDVRVSYQMGYYPAQENWDNKFHKLRVSCKRKGVHIQAQTGYYAWQEKPGSHAQEAFAAATSTSFDASEIGLRGAATIDPKDGRVTHVDLHIDAHDIALVQDGGEYRSQLRILLVHYMTDGRTESLPIASLDVDYNAAKRDKALQDGIDFAEDIPLGHPGTQFRIVVFDRGSNAVGSLTIPDYDSSHVVLPSLNGNH